MLTIHRNQLGAFGDELVQPCPDEPLELVNLYVYPGDIRPYIEPAGLFGLLQTLHTFVAALLRGDKVDIQRQLAAAGYPTDNLAQLPGYVQAEVQRLAGGKLRTIIVDDADDAIKQITALRDAGLGINNIVLETHGEHGRGFYIGDYDHRSEHFYDLKKLQDQPAARTHVADICSDMRGKLVLMGCEIGRNQALLVQVAAIIDRPVIASRSWVTDWPGMFNDPRTRTPTLTRKQRRRYADEIAEYLRIHHGKEILEHFMPPSLGCLVPQRALHLLLRLHVSRILRGFFKRSCRVSPSGSLDAIYSRHYRTDYPFTADDKEVDESGQEVQMTGQTMKRNHADVGHWCEVTPPPAGQDQASLRAVDNFYFNRDGDPLDGRPRFKKTHFGKAYRALIRDAQIFQDKLNKRSG